MIFYLLSLIPLLIWLVQLALNKKVHWKEAAWGSGAALLVAAIFQIISFTNVFVPSDTETWSGRVHYARFQPAWREYYEEAIYRTEYYPCGTSDNPQICSRQVFSHWEPHRRWHQPKWWTGTTLGEFSISEVRYQNIVSLFGDSKEVKGDRYTGEHASRLIEGSPNDQISVNKNEYIYPVTKQEHFENRLLKATGSLYNFKPVTPEEEKRLFKWPANSSSRFESERLLGTAKTLWDQRSWDQMNTILGPTKKVNLIAIGFPAGTAVELGMTQERFWNGGKKNDLVLTFGGDPKKPEWAYVFGWTESELVKRLLENRLREGTASVEEITKIVVENYRLLPFEEKFAHIEIDTPWWYYLIFFVVMIGTQFTAHFISLQENGNLLATRGRNGYISQQAHRRRDYVTRPKRGYSKY